MQKPEEKQEKRQARSRGPEIANQPIGIELPKKERGHR